MARQATAEQAPQLKANLGCLSLLVEVGPVVPCQLSTAGQQPVSNQFFLQPRLSSIGRRGHLRVTEQCSTPAKISRCSNTPNQQQVLGPI